VNWVFCLHADFAVRVLLLRFNIAPIDIMADEMQEGMILRGRPLPGAVPVVAQHEALEMPHPQPVEPEAVPAVAPQVALETPHRSQPIGILGTIRKRLSDFYSAIRTSTPFSAPKVEQVIQNDNQNGQQAPSARPIVTPGLTGLLPAASDVGLGEEVARPVVNNYTNCTFGSNTASSSSKGRKYKSNVPKFDDTKLDIEAYMANFNAITETLPPVEKLALLREKLEGRAAKVLASLDLQGEIVTFDSLVTALEKHYVGEKSEWVAKLKDVRREEGESIEDLAFRISLYSKRAYGRLQPDLTLGTSDINYYSVSTAGTVGGNYPLLSIDGADGN
jgi:hypothetical protein